MLSRHKNQVESIMPKKVETKILCSLSNTQVNTDHSRSETLSDGKLQGGVVNRTSNFKADKSITTNIDLCVMGFKCIRDENKNTS